MKVLIVDDSELLRDRLRDSLKVINNVEIVWEATNGIDALQIVKDKNPDFVILDIRMPEMSGITVLEKMKEQGIKSKICIFTNYPYLQYKLKCLEAGADYFFDKNHDFTNLLDLVRKLSRNNKHNEQSSNQRDK
jgi:DNA-binding NarL/FixJ family response regulator